MGMYGFGSIRHRETAEARLERLNNGFRAVSHDIDRSSPKKWFPHFTVGQLGVCGLMVSLVATGSLVFFAELDGRKWPLATKLKHMAAAPNCSAARAVGLAPSKRGEPGYYFRHDRDRDGIACEPWRRY
ncbi:MAG: excalibur calcium-binding domain-containing protein [Pseudomonadota bacterium]